ncbi:hypothetical protein NQ317_008267 [Molorchus minor]|uniref:Uncharacterized protein n=1 Tax=Molorchus minor TaxID=1323400 RepID=A0ABQ9J7V8_9CUCU|nr:hypothetical protein NQ317_008267 [Molorchus minor]
MKERFKIITTDCDLEGNEVEKDKVTDTCIFVQIQEVTIQTGQLRSSLDSHEAIREDNNLLDKFRKVASIVKGSFNGLEQTVVDGGENIEDENFEEEASQSVEKKVVAYYISPDSPSEYRLLSRSESAGDANIIDKLQNNKKPLLKIIAV